MYIAGEQQDNYCLTYFTYNGQNIGLRDSPYGHEKVSYCLQKLKENDLFIEHYVNSISDPSYSFTELKAKNISSSMLLLWSASLNLAEQYQIFLDTNSNSSFDKKDLFYNCTSAWFEPFCRFTFDHTMDKTFNDIVHTIFLGRFRINKGHKVTCYHHLRCKTLLSCLDWREICDGKRDCLDGKDEEHCWRLEINECADNEYRCHNGQCIPVEYLRDREMGKECLDGTDEAVDSANGYPCYERNGFPCEELMCRPGNQEFPCGDGQCTDGLVKCNNGRSAFLPADLCSNATACSMISMGLIDGKWCKKFCSNNICMRNHCQEIFEFHYVPILYGHVRFMFTNKQIGFAENYVPDYVCYDEKLCGEFLPPREYFDSLTCRHFNDLGLHNIDNYSSIEMVVNAVRKRFRACLTFIENQNYCNYSSMYQCQNSTKCISTHRLLDGFDDCPYSEDEKFNESCSLRVKQNRFMCSDEDGDKCFASLSFEDEKMDCKYGQDEAFYYSEHGTSMDITILFQNTCDGKADLAPVWIKGKNKTDETECHYWPCNNTYSRCDRCWLCNNGADEVNCPFSTCPPLQHHCVFPNDTSKLSCLSIEKAGNNITDCLGATDERAKHHINVGRRGFQYQFRCQNNTKSIGLSNICNGKMDCHLGDDEILCKNDSVSHVSAVTYSRIPNPAINEYYDSALGEIKRLTIENFLLYNIPTYPLQSISHDTLAISSQRINSFSPRAKPVNKLRQDYIWSCNRGIPIRVRTDENISNLLCMCPPSYYGLTCEYQNQRVSLTLQIRMTSDWHNIFIFLITLIDEERHVESHEYIEYLSSQYCGNRFNLYLLYSSRPKNTLKNYSVQIDAYNRQNLNYRASWLFPIRFSFLPVYRIAAVLKVPFENVRPIEKCPFSCIHGQCFNYINDKNSIFCRCDSGWSGVQCNVKHTCNCAPDSKCINDLICLCPSGRFGPRCYLYHKICHPNPCMNGGQCAHWNVNLGPAHPKLSICICLPGYTGDYCQYIEKQNQIDISFHRTLTIPIFLLIHFISVESESKDKVPRTSIMKKLAFDQESVVFNISVSFNIAFVEISKKYYLIILREKFIISEHISPVVTSSNRCPSFSEIFNETFANQHLLKRVKYYHIPCKDNSELVCFYDNDYFCLCDLNHQANCLLFEHNMTYDCKGYNPCKNEGFCFINDYKCPTLSFCVCRQCYFGSRCQYSTLGSILSLDIILTYHIKSNISIIQQSMIVKISIILTTFIYSCGTVNGFFCFQTFRKKETRGVGCGIYLFVMSIISFITMTIFNVKFWLLLALQIGWINNRFFLDAQCAVLEFFLRLLSSTSDWLYVCIAIERAINVSQGVSFRKAKSRQIAKWIVGFVLIFNICTFKHDPIHRHLTIDEEEQQHGAWCITSYSSSIQIYDYIISIFHYCIPFSINCISALFIIYKTTDVRSNARKERTFKKHLYEQIKMQKHLIIAPSILIIFAFPRLIISFLSGCMQSARNSWFYLMGYFISFIPPMTTFIVFILPSEIYMKEFKKSMKSLCHR